MKYLQFLFVAICCLSLAGCMKEEEMVQNSDIDASISSNAEVSSSAEVSSGAELSSTESSTSASYKKISTKEGKQMLEEDSSIILLDVRTKEEYDKEHIDQSLLVPDTQIESLIEAAIPDKNTTVIIYCRSGNRSKSAATKMLEMGYTAIFDMGGIKDWKYETIKS